MARPNWVPAGTDLDKPNAARVYDYYLGGSHNFEVDRQMARKAIELWPDLPKIMRANRAFLRRATQFAAEEGISRFLDIGSGIPTFGAVHEVAREYQPDARVVYVDMDPVAVAHSRLILADDPRCRIVDADLRNTDDLLARPEVEELLAPGEPVAVILNAVMHFVTDEDHPDRILTKLREALPSGSMLILSHASLEGRPDQAGSHQSLYRSTPTPLTMRSREQITAFFEGYELVEPGVVYLPEWHPDDAASVGPHPERMTGMAGVGRLS
ncbi:SAM-dependent methyltransferase [Kitasatospora sp. YST-16]|uniref:SAM-dependent methyltransferase n=1 Tax=Kitasatospora sp. YST-16 TaxID=2998080 RepID=UPI00228335A0|nr:SAM-dependent methyltransferase [Kitasatospora sp. YST-16]WAL75328.1 SAM-dependent methyltransferase [Kitasatospora sp. YST-16]WNW41388.1 SAM-dependent methyltransferase [Streptomyces sp. Li-HN-5-13]